VKSPLQKPRLRRLERYTIESPTFFITLCTHERRRILANASVHQTFILFGGQAKAHGVLLGRYVLMPDHIHCFAGFESAIATVSNAIRFLKNSLSKTLKQLGNSPPYWQRGFFDHVLRSCESYSQKWEYVRQNPVRAGLASSPEEWLYQGEIHILPYS